MDRLGVGLNRARAHVTALRLGREGTRGPSPVVPADRRGRRDTVSLSRSSPAQACANRRDYPFPQVHGKWFAHRCPQISIGVSDSALRPDGNPQSIHVDGKTL